jgi:hypothetical protein
MRSWVTILSLLNVALSMKDTNQDIVGGSGGNGAIGKCDTTGDSVMYI